MQIDNELRDMGLTAQEIAECLQIFEKQSIDIETLRSIECEEVLIAAGIRGGHAMKIVRHFRNSTPVPTPSSTPAAGIPIPDCVDHPRQEIVGLCNVCLLHTTKTVVPQLRVPRG